MIFCLLGLNGDDYDDDRSEAWCNSLDRGGLWHIKDEAYSLFHAIEVIRQTLTLEAVSKQCKGATAQITNHIMESDNVLFWWRVLVPECEASAAVGSVTLKKIVDLYVTIRGFAFTSSCLEIYKQSKRKALQRSKGIRKELFTSRV